MAGQHLWPLLAARFDLGANLVGMGDDVSAR